MYHFKASTKVSSRTTARFEKGRVSAESNVALVSGKCCARAGKLKPC